ncbi:hypothetical protein GCM10017674_81320 [Streptomyces gardneri]|uniref:Uncharacterized protein n=1 Tax=Streptomyces gardneri TaxID=66892 RepID=A0A4Y3RCH5_9ACTN|nr:hypothetical protein SGA01_00120 [Streptomyces gardneri]GHH24136.1 hypothetical protein GCM10017674_81320 [Streptomyces gardneri]
MRTQQSCRALVPLGLPDLADLQSRVQTPPLRVIIESAAPRTRSQSFGHAPITVDGDRARGEHTGKIEDQTAPIGDISAVRHPVIVPSLIGPLGDATAH